MTTERYEWDAIVSGLNQYLRLRSIPIGMKLFETVEAMEAIPKIRRPKVKHTTDQIVAQARQLGWTVGITMADLVGAQCGAVIGLHPQDEEWLSGHRMAGVWFETQADASRHQHAMDCVPYGRYAAMAVAPLTSGRLDPPDICLIYGTPGQMIFFINGLQWTGQEDELHLGGRVGLRGFLGQGAQDGRARAHHPLLRRAALRRRGRRRAADGHPAALPAQGDRGPAALSKNGLRYPIPPYGIQSDAAPGLAVSYAAKERG